MPWFSEKKSERNICSFRLMPCYHSIYGMCQWSVIFHCFWGEIVTWHILWYCFGGGQTRKSIEGMHTLWDAAESATVLTTKKYESPDKSYQRLKSLETIAWKRELLSPAWPSKQRKKVLYPHFFNAFTRVWENAWKMLPFDFEEIRAF